MATGEDIADGLLAVVAQAKADEREACAKIAESMDYSVTDLGPPEEGKTFSGVCTIDNRDKNTPERIAAAIRARSNSVQ